MPQNIESFSSRILSWFAIHGRHDLPWQQHQKDIPDPYQVWLSEVMLQQTQVVTVIPYFQRFMQKFDTVHLLAKADWDEVAELWAGLGYYARARNLHKGAKQLVEIIEQTGDFPQSVAEWEQISGVGLSTAGAVVAMGLRGYGVICDGNVKRVLTRWAGIQEDITLSTTNKKLWQLAEQLTPTAHSGHYAQAMMDMGATICTRSKPACSQCPIKNDCIAYAQGNQTLYPIKRKAQPKPTRHSHVIKLYDHQQQLLWLKRPAKGIWGGLWCLPIIPQKISLTPPPNSPDTQPKDQTITTYQIMTPAEQVIETFLMKHAITQPKNMEKTIRHTLTHFHWSLSLSTICLTAKQSDELTQELTHINSPFHWLSAAQAQNLAKPKAMDKLFVVNTDS